MFHYGCLVPDPIFEVRRLAEIYDSLDSDRTDLDMYLGLVEDFGAGSILDIGCGTGTFACLAARQGVEVTAVDPASASLEVASRKPGARRVRWLQGDAATLPELQADLATMTGNVAQVFLTDEGWASAVRCTRAALRPGGQFVFEARDPAQEAWHEWNREQTYVRANIPAVGVVERWVDLTDVSGELVSFRHTFVFESDGQVLTSDSTLRFRHQEAIAESLLAADFMVAEVRDAPDRPGSEFVFIAVRPD